MVEQKMINHLSSSLLTCSQYTGLRSALALCSQVAPPLGRGIIVCIAANLAYSPLREGVRGVVGQKMINPLSTFGHLPLRKRDI